MKIIIIISILMMASAVFLYDYTSTDDIEYEEDISSYDIKSRYDCNKIQDSKTYNKCLEFYISKTPYNLGDDLVPTRLIE